MYRRIEILLYFLKFFKIKKIFRKILLKKMHKTALLYTDYKLALKGCS